MTFVQTCPKGSALHRVTIPALGGDTIWANTVTAYAGLPEPLRPLADGLRPVHSNAYDYAAQRLRATDQDRKHYAEVFASDINKAEHPVGRVHPETGEKLLLLGRFVQRVSGLSPNDSQKLLEISFNPMSPHPKTRCAGAGRRATL